MRSRKLKVVAMLAALVVGACGGSGGTPTSGPNATTTGGQPTAAGGQPTAAGGGATTKPGGGTAGACAALSLADIKTATGVDYPAGAVDDTGACVWEFTVNTYSNLSLSIDSKTSFANIKAGFPGGTDMTIGGHPAYMGVSGTVLQSLWVDLGSSVLSIMIAPAPANAQDVVKRLAEVALAKM